MRPYVKLLWPLVTVGINSKSFAWPVDSARESYPKLSAMSIRRPFMARHNDDGLSGRGLVTLSGHDHTSFNKITGNWDTDLYVTPIWWYTGANWKFLKTNAFSANKFSISIFEYRLKLIILWYRLGMSFYFPNIVLFPKMVFPSPKLAFWLWKSIRFWEFTVSLSECC